jgi:hypothetical protein
MYVTLLNIPTKRLYQKIKADCKKQHLDINAIIKNRYCLLTIDSPYDIQTTTDKLDIITKSDYPPKLEETLPTKLLKQKIQPISSWIFRHGGCNLVAEIVQQELNLDCYMVYHKYLDYDETGTRNDDNEQTITTEELNNFQRDYHQLKQNPDPWEQTSRPIGHVYFIDHDAKNKPILCDGLGKLRLIKNSHDPKLEIKQQFREDFENFNFDPIGCHKITRAEFTKLNYTSPLSYSTNAWYMLFPPVIHYAIYKELVKYVQKRPWLKND